MWYLGIDFQSDQTFWASIFVESGEVSKLATGSIKIGGTKSAKDMKQYEADLKQLFAHYPATKIAIKDKLETGRMRAGAAAMKMEGIFLLTAPCEVKFLSPRAVAKAMDMALGVAVKCKDAYRAAVAISKA